MPSNCIVVAKPWQCGGMRVLSMVPLFLHHFLAVGVGALLRRESLSMVPFPFTPSFMLFPCLGIPGQQPLLNKPATFRSHHTNSNTRQQPQCMGNLAVPIALPHRPSSSLLVQGLQQLPTTAAARIECPCLCCLLAPRAPWREFLSRQLTSMGGCTRRPAFGILRRHLIKKLPSSGIRFL